MQKMYKTPNVRTSIAIIGHTKTGLFDTFNVGAAGRFMAPLLEPDYVADLIVDAFESQESKQIFTPFTNHLLPGIKAYPSFLRDGIQALSGADGSYPTRPSPEQLNGGIVNGKGH
jgi:all-trans-retinol dehydrogenase (NAD+)